MDVGSFDLSLNELENQIFNWSNWKAADDVTLLFEFFFSQLGKENFKRL